MSIVCSICMNNLAHPAENINVTKCGHAFHYRCLSQWMSRSKSCPQCRSTVTNNSTFRLYLTIISDESTGADPENDQKEREKNDVALLKAIADSALKYVNIQNNEILKLRDANETLSNKMQTLSRELCESEKEKNQLRNKLRMIKQQLAMEKSNNATLQEKILALCESENKKNKLRNKLKMIKQQLAMEKSNNATLQEKILALCESENKKNKLRNKLKMIKQQLAMEKSNNATLQEKILMLDNPKSKRKSLTLDDSQTVKKRKILNDAVQ